MTWGISGPAFLAVYAVALVGLSVALVISRSRATRGGPYVPASTLSLDVTAMLSGGGPLVATAALVGLQEAGSIESIGRSVRPGSRAPREPSAVQHSVWRTIRARGALDVAEARRIAAADAGTADARRSLESRGLMPSVEAARRHRGLVLGVWALLAVGVSRVVAGIGNHRPVLSLVLLLVVTSVVAVTLVRLPRLTTAGEDALSQLRLASDPLRSGGLPGQRALAVALFGAGVLWVAEPELAGMLGLHRQTAAAAGHADAGGCGSGGGCSGGGGSRCGSGSSCGGGCGGGGCGG